MKNLLAATLPALALLTLGGCATSGALTTSTENDGVYYSSSDHTTAVASPSAAAYGSEGTIPARALDDTTPTNVATTDDANPDYQGGTAAGNATGTDYYNNTYNNGLSSYSPNGFNQPYNGPGVSSYNYAPAYGASPSYYGSPYGYNSAFGYGYSPFSYGYSPFGYGSPYGGGFYDPFYSPFGYGYGSGLSIGFGYGFGGFGGFGSPFGYGYSPFGYGSAYGYGSPYGYGSGYGYGGYGGYGGGDYARHVIYTRGAGASSPGANAVLYGSRTNRGGAVMNPNVNANGNPNAVNLGGRPSAGSYTGNAVAIPGGGGNAGMPAAPTVRGGRSDRGGSFGGATGQPSYSTPGTQVNATATPNAAPGAGGRRGFFGGFFGNGTPNANAAGQPTTAGQPANSGSYGSRQRSYSNYGQGQNTQQPLQQRSYSQPQRTYSQPQPNYSQPSPSRSFGGGSFGGGGGGSFGGGGGGGGGGRGRR